jgi:rhamnosyltransferase
LFLTQDAIPTEANCLEELIKAVQDDDIACAYGRQIAPKDATRIEVLSRQINYPSISFVRSAKDIPSLQIRAFFLSNSCCLYKRDLYLQCGGFQHDLPSNEDMLIAAKFMQNNYRIAYCASACILHEHNTTLKRWCQRSFDSGAFMEMYSRQLGNVRATAEGKKYVLFIIKELLREGRIFSVFYFCLICMGRLLYDRAGRRYTRLTNASILRRTQNPAFWQRYLREEGAAYTSDPLLK